MKNFFVFMFVAIAALNITAVGQTPPAGSQATPTPVKATKAASDDVTVIFYRYKAFAGSALEPGVFVDNVEIAKMDNGRWFKATLTPGKHVLQSNDKQSGIELDLKPDEDYYIRVDIVAGFWKGHGRVSLVPKEQGAFEIKKLKPLGKNKVKDPKRVIVE